MLKCAGAQKFLHIYTWNFFRRSQRDLLLFNNDFIISSGCYLSPPPYIYISLWKAVIYIWERERDWEVSFSICCFIPQMKIAKGERERERKKEGRRSVICWFTPATDECKDQNWTDQELGVSSKVPPAVFPGSLVKGLDWRS